jgi:hypothetical protein
MSCLNWKAVGAFVYDDRGMSVAEALCEIPNPSPAGTAALARLLAAAPDLAAVLREVADFWAGGDAPQALTDKINAALAKAGV